MRAMDRPAYVANAGFNACIDDIISASLKSRLTAIVSPIAESGSYYDTLATNGTLHEMPRSELRDDQLQVGEVTKGELKNLYDGTMVAARKSARVIYDNLRASAPFGRCPTCGFGQVSTLDHFLPKALFPLFSVLVQNLVPACRDCNMYKRAAAAEDAQSFHPYYDHTPLIRDRWLYAEILFTNPVSARYFVQAPPHWTHQLARRAENHFREYDLAKRFAVEAANEISALIPTFTQKPRMSALEIRNALTRRLNAHRQQQCNSWQVGLLEALHDCDWFCNLRFDHVG